MRTIFSIDLKADIASGDEETAQIMVDMCVAAARQLFTQATLILKKPPEAGVRTSDSMKGTQEVALFDKAE